MNFLLDLRTEFCQSHLLHFDGAGVKLFFQLALFFSSQRRDLAEQVRNLFFSLRFHGLILLLIKLKVKKLILTLGNSIFYGKGYSVN
jgi:hypothetical protein